MIEESKIFISVEQVRKLLAIIDISIWDNAPDNYEAITAEIDIYCEENQMNFDNPVYEEFHYTPNMRLEIVKTILNTLHDENED